MFRVHAQVSLVFSGFEYMAGLTGLVAGLAGLGWLSGALLGGWAGCQCKGKSSILKRRLAGTLLPAGPRISADIPGWLASVWGCCLAVYVEQAPFENK